MYVDLPSAIFHSIQPPFDAEVAEKFLNGIYSLITMKITKRHIRMELFMS